MRRPGFAYPSDSEEESERRVVKAHKDRKFEELKDLIKQAKNSKNIKDMSKLLTSWFGYLATAAVFFIGLLKILEGFVDALALSSYFQRLKNCVESLKRRKRCLRVKDYLLLVFIFEILLSLKIL